MAGRTRMPSTNRDGVVRGASGGPGILGSFAAQQQQQQVRAAMAVQQQQTDMQRAANGPTIVDQTIQALQNEIRLLLTENQHLAATHVALRQELVAAQQDAQRNQALFAGFQAEKDGQVRAILENSAKLEADLRATEPIKMELQQARIETKRYTTLMQDLNQQLRNVTTELQRTRTEVQQIPALKADLENLRQELQRTRTAYEYEKTLNSQCIEQKQIVEKSLVAMARETEILRSEINNYREDRRARFNPSAGGYDGGASPADGYSRQQQQIMAAEEYGSAYGSPGPSQWAYESQRRNGLSQGRR